MGRVGIPDEDFHHEAIELGLGQGVRPLELDRVLRGKDGERRREGMAHAVHSHDALLHRLEERGLGLRRRAIDLVREHQVREDGAGPEREIVRPREDAHARNVRGHQVRRELDSLEFDVQRQGEGPDEQRLGRAGHALEQHVAAGEQANQHLARRGLLTQHDSSERL